MDGISLIVVLFIVGLVLLVMEVFIPSHGLLTVASIGVLVLAVAKTYAINPLAGNLAGLGCLVMIPMLLYAGVKVWPHTYIGRRIAPPNQVLDETSMMHKQSLTPLLGQEGRSVSPLRPVGTCQFADRRVVCRSEMGMIDNDKPVRAVAVEGPDLVVEEIGNTKSSTA